MNDRPGRRRRPPPTPTQRALGLLTRREHSRRELERKLTARGVDAGDAQAAVAKLADAGWQDDARFAESLLRSRIASGYGPRHIRAELGTHGLDDGAIEAAMAITRSLTATSTKLQLKIRLRAMATNQADTT